ncbi:MAG: hypothetical protein EA381_02370 [Planctomycetaceae bacterium]|nr:MAG: hypothetical protein EA381_02370 [Planctomycetaceae bacterium]
MSLRFLSIGLLILACGTSDQVTASDREPVLVDADGLLQAAFEAEARGDRESRRRLLADSIELDPTAPEPRWHAGLVQGRGGSWKDIDSSIQEQSRSSIIKRYEVMRKKISGTAMDHWQLSIWCANNRLEQQCVAHLHQVIELDNNHAGARAALGHIPVGGQWLTTEHQQSLQRRQMLAERSLARYHDDIATHIDRMVKGPQKFADRAKYELLNIRDPLSVFALENAAATSPSGVVEVILECIDSIDSPEASQALARFALLHPDAVIRDKATAYLETKPLYDYVPELLDMLSGPIQFSMVPFFDRRGKFLGYRQAFANEGMDEVRLSIGDRRFERVAVVPRNARNRRGELLSPFERQLQTAILDQNDRIINQMALQRASNEIAVSQQSTALANEGIRNRNEAISALVSKIARQDFAGDSNAIWEWWDQYNDTYYQEYKPHRYDYNSVSDRIPDYRPTRAIECFVAGTPVMTQQGTRPIEQVAVGDLVLSRDIPTGRLGWEPVLKVTSQPPKETVTLVLDNEELTCTPGHLFWVSGEGWKKAAEIEASDWLHGASEPVQVTGKNASGNQVTYNLQVHNQRTYFVGQGLILSHDVTPRRATRESVPGYRRPEMQVAKIQDAGTRPIPFRED